MARTKQEQYDDIDAALVAIERGAQSYTCADGRTVTKGNTFQYYAERRELARELATATPGAIRLKPRFGGAS